MPQTYTSDTPNNTPELPPLPTDEEGNPVVDLAEELPGIDGLSFDENKPNLVEDFMKTDEGKKALEDIANRVRRDFDADWDGTSRYRQRMRSDWQILAGDLPTKNWPFVNCANAHVPIMLENITRLSCRIESELFGDWANVFGVMPVGPGDEDFADILTLHGNWQIREQIPDFERQMQRGLLMFLAIGDVTFHSYWDPLTRQNVHEALTPDEFVVPFSYVSTRPDYGDLPHYTKILRWYRYQIQAYEDRWENVQEVLDESPASWGDEPDMPMRQANAETQGEDMPTEVPGDLANGAPYVLLQYEGWMKLPTQKRDRFVQVIVDYRTKNILSLAIHEEANWQDRARYEQQALEMQMYSQNKMANDQHVAEFSGLQGLHQQAVASGEMTPMQQSLAEQKLAEMAPPPPPPAPKWLANPDDLQAQPEEPRKDPILMFSHGVCLEPLTGTLGLSFGRILADYNRAANTVLSQAIDQATLANAGGIIAPDSLEFDRPFAWSPGKITKVKGLSGIEMKNAIMPFQAPPANPQMFQILQLMGQYGQAAAQSPEVLSGEPGKSGETYRGIATRIEQATKQLSIIGRRFARTVRQVLQNNARLNAIFLPDEEIIRVTEAAAATASPPIVVTRDMYRRDYRVEIRADLQFTSEAEKIAEADQILQLITAFPPLQSDLSFVYQAIKRCLPARHRQDMVIQLGPEPPPPQTPFGINPMGIAQGAPPPGQGAPPRGPTPPGPNGSGQPQQASPPQTGPSNGQVVHPQGPGGPVTQAA